MTQRVKNLPAMWETQVRSLVWKTPGEGKGSPLQFSGLENSMDCILHGVVNSWTQLRDFDKHYVQKYYLLLYITIFYDNIFFPQNVLKIFSYLRNSLHTNITSVQLLSCVSFNISPCNEHSGLISFKMDWMDLLAVQGTLKSLIQHHSSKASILRCTSFFIVL